MNNLEKKIKRDSISKIEASMPQTELDREEVPYKKKVTPGKVFLGLGIGVSSFATLIVLVPAAYIIAIGFHTKTNDKSLSREYSLKEVKDMEAETFKRANSFEYPEGAFEAVDPQYEEALNSFAYKMYNASSLGRNGSFAPLSTYFHLDLLSEGILDETTKGNMDNLLGTSKDVRDDNFVKAFLSDRDKGSESTSHIEMYNASFMDSRFTYRDSVLSKYTSKYCEAYYCDFQKESDQKKMLSWVNSRKSNQMQDMKVEDLNIKDDSRFALFSLMDFTGKWGFEKENNSEKNFLSLDGNESKVTFMNDGYTGNAYKYDGYWSFKTHFYGGYTIQFLTPDKREDNIHTLLANSGRNFLVEDESKMYVPPYNWETSDGKMTYVVEISLPKFSSSSEYRLNDTLSNLGLGSLYERNDTNKVLSGLFKEDMEYAYCDYSKQRNVISWDEDGTRVTSVTWSFALGAGAASPITSGIHFDLDSPFVYVIRDKNNLPIFMGNVDFIR